MDTSMTNRVAAHWENAPYYDKVEPEEMLSLFWGEHSVFFHLFQKMDLAHTVELACGHGRHVRKYLHQCDSLVLADILQKNIDFCMRRFKSFDNIEYLVTSENTFRPLEDASKTAIFSYDAMVHFELPDVSSYLADTCRVLTPGGKALFHHSNYTANPGGFYQENPHWRNFMSADIFAHLAIRAGLRVVSQNVIRWGEHQNIDCVSLCQKP